MARARYILATSAVVLSTAAALFAYAEVDQFLIRDGRFALAAPGGGEFETGNLVVEGARFASVDRITQAFARDFGRSVYLFPLTERRRQLLAIDWVRDASVSRIWPNRVVARVVERSPVAFTKFPAINFPATSARPADYALIDEEGVLLPLVKGVRFRVAVVTGLRREEPEASRKVRIAAMLRMQKDLGADAANVSEVDMEDAENIRVTYPVDGRAIVLHLGNAHFAERLALFLKKREELRSRNPNATAFDLRYEDRIIAMGEPDGE